MIALKSMKCENESDEKYIKKVTSSRGGWSPYSLENNTDSNLYRKRIFKKEKE